ncbi:MAG: cell division protein CrgA [Kocuria sp.]|uniref:cell division protein CrgA n=1 Tax=Kocuria sp. TaxID=1871328 RepID=UPI0026DAE4BF|nr:cell division protein CrgA [Kocuria sp.]MDO4257300.1 cell division protein CrgA [Kocuria sp.]
MAQSQKRFRRSRKDDDDAQQFVLTDRDRELAALAAEILPRNSAAASFERRAARNAGSTSVSAKDAVTDHELVDDDAPAARAHGTSEKAAGKSTGTATAGTDADAATGAEGDAASAGGAKSAGRKKRAGNNPRKGASRVGATARTDAAASAAAEGSRSERATGAAAKSTETAEETPAELKARRKRELAAKRREEKAAKAEERERREEKAAKAEERERRAVDYQPTPTWYKVIMVGLMIVALLWIISYYLFQGLIPIPGIGVWNLVIGLGFMLTGLIMTTRWR